MSVVRLAAICSLLVGVLGHAAPASASDQEAARALVRTAREAFEAGEFAKAAELLSKAAALVPTPAAFYNLGRAKERAQDLAGAEAAYLEYLRLAPAASDRGEIEATIASLRERIEQARRLEVLERERAQRAPPKGPAVATEVRQASPPKKGNLALRIGGYVSAGLGVAAVGVGVGLGVHAQNRHAAAVSAPVLNDALGLQRTAEDAARGATAAYLTGGLLLGTGLVLLLLDLFLFSEGT